MGADVDIEENLGVVPPDHDAPLGETSHAMEVAGREQIAGAR